MSGPMFDFDLNGDDRHVRNADRVLAVACPVQGCQGTAGRTCNEPHPGRPGRRHRFVHVERVSAALEGTMKGSNELEVNEATVIEALQLLVDRDMPGAGKVTSVHQQNGQSAGRTFRVHVEAPAPAVAS